MPNSIKYSTTGDTQSLRDGNFYIGTGDVGKGPTSSTGHWNGITPPGGGYTVYKNKVSNGPAIWTATSDNQLISLTNNTEGTSFTTIQPCLNYYAAQTDKMVFNKDYEGIITNGLVLNLDAGFIPSYQGSGTTWYDLSYSGNNGTLANGPTFSSDGGGSIVFDSTDDEVNTSYGPTLGDFTIGIWFKDNTSPAYGRLVDKSYTGGFWLGRNASAPNSWGGGIKEISDPYGIFVTLTDGQWNYLTSIRSGTTHILYGNGITNTTSNTVTSSALDSTTISIGAWSGPENSQRFKGNIGVVQVYNRALSATEVLQNYNAGLSRFNTSNMVKSGLVINLDSSNTVSYPTTGTTWLDLGGYGYKGTLTNGPTFDSTSRTIVFDGTDDYIQLSGTVSLNVWTITVILSYNYQNKTYEFFLGDLTNGAQGKILLSYAGQVSFRNTNYYNFSKNSSTLSNRFSNLSFVSNGTNISLYVDGVFDSSVTPPSTNIPLNTIGNAWTDLVWLSSFRLGDLCVYNRALSVSEILQNYYQAPIVTSGLLMALDAGNLVSYSGAGTTWKDLTTNGKNGTLTNGPTYSSTNGGSIVFDGSDDYLITPTITNFRTISLWIKTSNTGGGWRYLIDARPGMGSGWYTGFESVGGVGSNWASQYVNGSPTTVAFSNITLGTWCNLVVISDAPYTSTINFMSRFSNAEMLNGSIGNIMIYNKVLTADEVAQNYNAQKSRFGL